MLVDTQKVVDRLVESGVPMSQARVHAAVLADVIGSVHTHSMERYATKDDLSRAVAELKAEIADLRTDLIRWALTIAATAVAVQTALNALLKYAG
jgi:hypothetical protein